MCSFKLTRRQMNFIVANDSTNANDKQIEPMTASAKYSSESSLKTETKNISPKNIFTPIIRSRIKMAIIAIMCVFVFVWRTNEKEVLA